MALESCPRDLQGEHLALGFLQWAGRLDVWSQCLSFQNVVLHKNTVVLSGSLTSSLKSGSSTWDSFFEGLFTSGFAQSSCLLCRAFTPRV